MKKRFTTFFLYLFTFGVYYFVAHNKAKKMVAIEHKELTLSNEIPFNINKLINYLGGKENIKGTKQGINRIGVEVNNKEKVNIEAIKKLGATGVFIVQNNISLLFGTVSSAICKEIQENIKTNNKK